MTTPNKLEQKGFTCTPSFGVSLQGKRGFTLVETLVAVSILSLSIAATFTAVQGGIQSSTISKDQVTAFYLAQEGMEFIRNIRDENALHSVDGSPTNWLAGFNSQCFDTACTIDSPLKLVAACSGSFGSCPFLRQDSNTGLFGYTSTWTPTNFKREIQFAQIVSHPDEVLVTINISWLTRGNTQSFKITESLLNHQ